MHEEFHDLRLAELYDALDGPRDDLAPYLYSAEDWGVHTALDIGCGTGALALRLAAHDIDVEAVDPAGAMLAVAHAKPGADRVRWLLGDATAVTPRGDRDLVTMTANTAMHVVADGDWQATVRVAAAALTPHNHLVLETRVPAARAWERWTREQTNEVVDVPGRGPVERWCEVLDVAMPLITYRWTFVLADGARRTSTSTLRWREQDELTGDLEGAGLQVHRWHEAPDRPGREWLLVARPRVLQLP